MIDSQNFWINKTDLLYVLNTVAGQGAQILVLVNMENSPILEKARCSRFDVALHLKIAENSTRMDYRSNRSSCRHWPAVHGEAASERAKCDRRKRRPLRMCRQPSPDLLWSNIGRVVTRPGLWWQKGITHAHIQSSQSSIFNRLNRWQSWIELEYNERL